MSEKLDELKNAAIEAESTVENLKAEVNALESAEEVDKAAVKAKKAELRKAEGTLKKANTAVGKEVRAEKEAERAAKKEAREVKKAEREEAKEAKKAEREANRMPEQNGIRRPKPEGKCGQVWGIADKLSADYGQPTPIKELLEACSANGLNEGNVKAEYARWRKYHGVTGRISLPKAEAAE